MEITKLLAAARRYQNNRRNRLETPWNKIADCDNIFEEMVVLGIGGCHAMAGSFFGETDGRMFAMDILPQVIRVGLFNDFEEYLHAR